MTPPPAGNTAVLLTPAGPGAIAVIRLIGPGNDAFAATHLSKTLRTMRCVHCDLFDGDGQVIDDVVAVRTDAGHLDLNVHAGPWVVQAMLHLAERCGYTVKGMPPGDGSISTRPQSRERGVIDGLVESVLDTKDSIEQQMLIDLPFARTKATLRMLTAQPAAWQAMLANNDNAAMRRAIADTTLVACLRVPTVAIVGPPNVGKSTLANALFARERSITADRPGTTRDWVGELADLDGVVVRLIDTPGVRATDDPIEAAAIERAGGVIATADCVVVLIDGSRPTTSAEAAAVAAWRNNRPPDHPGPSEQGAADDSVRQHARRPAVLTVHNKADLPAVVRPGVDAIAVSARTGQGIDDLRAAIRSAVGVTDLVGGHARCWTVEQRYKLHERLNR